MTLLDSTPRQLMLAETLKFEPPSYSDAPLMLGPDGCRMIGGVWRFDV